MKSEATPQTFEQLAEKEYPYPNSDDWRFPPGREYNQFCRQADGDRAAFLRGLSLAMPLVEDSLSCLTEYYSITRESKSLGEAHNNLEQWGWFEQSRAFMERLKSFPSIGKEDEDRELTKMCMVASEKSLAKEWEEDDEWINVEDKPLVDWDINDNGQRAWTTTNAGDKEFFAAVPYKDKRQPGKELWWIRYCVIDHRGLCVIGDEDNDPAGWEIEDVTHYRLFPLPYPPIKKVNP